jgi:hypothetical protein
MFSLICGSIFYNKNMRKSIWEEEEGQWEREGAKRGL